MLNNRQFSRNVISRIHLNEWGFDFQPPIAMQYLCAIIFNATSMISLMLKKAHSVAYILKLDTLETQSVNINE